MTRRHPEDIEPLPDQGLFGPDSVTQKVWGFAGTPIIGIQRATVIEELDPHLIAAVDGTGANYDRLPTRYERTVRYFATVAFGDAETAVRLADVLVKIHSTAVGVDPVTQRVYDANDPDSQLWILVTGWHSVLATYETYGPGPLSDDEVRQFWSECAVAAELQTCDPADVPRSREEVREYFAAMRPRLAASEAAQHMMDHLLDGVRVITPHPVVARPAVYGLNALVRAGTIATMPRWMRDLSGFRQSRLIDAAVRPPLRLGFAVISRSLRLRMAVLRLIAPSTVPVMAPHWYGLPPIEDVVRDPAEVRRGLGLERPAQAHLALRERQRRRRLLEQGPASDEGFRESEAVLGALA